jgi:hypothetical protein
MTTLAEYRQSIIDSVPWLYWSMEEGTGTTLGDDSGNTRDGAATLAAGGWDLARPFANARAPYALITSTGATQAAEWSGTLPIGGAGTIFSFMVWVRVISTAAGQVCFSLESSAAAAAFEMRVTNLLCTYYQNGTTNSPHSLTSGTWANIIGVRSATNFIVYVNGTAQTTWASAPTLTGHDRLRVRSATGGSSEFAHLTWWDRALTGTEITAFNVPVTGTLPSTAAFVPQIPPIYSLSRSRTPASLSPIFVSSRDSLAYTPARTTTNIAISDEINSAALTTASVTPLPISSDLSADVTCSATLTKTQTNVTAEQFKNRIIATAPWAYYPMDDGAGTTVADASGNARNATLNATLATWQAETATNCWGPYSVLKNTTIGNGVVYTGTVPLQSSTQGYSMLACINISQYQTTGHHVAIGQLDFTDNISPDFRFTVNSNVISSRTGVAATWYKVLVTHAENNTAMMYSINAANALVITKASVAQPTVDAGTIIVSASGITGTLATQNVAFWDHVLTHQEVMDILMGDVVTTGLIDLAGSMDVEADVIEGSLSAALVGYTELDLGTSSLDVDVSIADAPLYTLISGTMDVDVTLDSGALFMTIFVAISSTDLSVDVLTNDPLLRKATVVDLATALSILTLNSATSAGSPSYITVSQNAIYTLRAAVRTSYRPPMSIPIQVTTPVSDTDPAQAVGLVIKAMMGVAVDMNDPIIVDGRPL